MQRLVSQTCERHAGKQQLSFSGGRIIIMFYDTFDLIENSPCRDSIFRPFTWPSMRRAGNWRNGASVRRVLLHL